MKHAESLRQCAARFVLAACCFLCVTEGRAQAEEADAGRDPFAFDLEETVTEESPPTAEAPVAKAVGHIRFGEVTIELVRDAQGDMQWLRREGIPGAETSDRAGITDPRQPISLNFRDIDIQTALSVLADVAGENIVLSEAVQGTLSLHLNDVPWQRAFEIVLLGGGLGMRREGNVTLVAPQGEIAGYEVALLRGRAEAANLAPLVTELVQIQHTEATALHALVSGGGGQSRALSERGSASVDERTNTLILTDTRERLDALRGIVAAIDIPVRQVLIEARIVNVNKRNSEQLGVLWHLSNKGDAATATPAAETDGANAPGSGTAIGFQLGLAATGESARFGIGFIDGGKQVDLELSALESKGVVEIVARPKVITADQHRATVESGVEIPYQQAASSGATATAFKEAVLQLEVTPRITPGDWVSLDLEVKQDTIGAVFGGVPSVNTTKIITRVLVDNGATVVLGGIAQTDSNTSIAKTPLLGDIPGIGWLFRRKISRDDEQELLVFITPNILAGK